MLLPIAYEGEGRDGYRDQIVTCDVGVSLHSKTHPLFMKYSKGKSTQYYALSELVSCVFSTIPICPFLIQRIFHSLVFFYFKYSFSANQELNFLAYGENICRHICTQFTNEICPFL